MPEQISNAADHNAAGFISNALEDMTQGSIGPEQSDCRINVCEYVKFDYAGKFANDPFIAVHASCTPLDGSNEGKDFDIEWVTGAKYSEFNIVNDGGNLAATGSRSSLSSGSNWALFLKAMADCSFKSESLNGPAGIRSLSGLECTVRRVKQPTREGLADKNESGRDKTYYTCLKITAMPGEAKKGQGTRRAAIPTHQAQASTSATAPASSSAVVPAPASTGANGHSPSLVGFVSAALAESNNSIKVSDLGRAVFKLAKAAGGGSAKSYTDLGTLAMSDDFLYEHAMEQGWTIADGVLTSA